MNRQEIQEIRTAINLDAKLLKYSGVIGVDVDYKQVKGQKTDKFGITVYVKKKLAENELSVSDIVPSKIEGIQTDLIECPNVWPSPEYTEQSAAQVQPRAPVLFGGLSISNQFNPTYQGTLGIVILSNNVPTALSCAHIMLSPPAKPGQGVMEPSGTQGGTYPKDSIGTVTQASYGNNNLDAAIVPIQGRSSTQNFIQNIGNVNGWISPAVSQRVGKMGITTGLTEGLITSTTLTWSYTTPLGGITLYNQIRVDNTGGSVFAQPGDSGSAVVNTNYLMVGMVVSGVPNNFTVCNSSNDLFASGWIPTMSSFSKKE